MGDELPQAGGVPQVDRASRGFPVAAAPSHRDEGEPLRLVGDRAVPGEEDLSDLEQRHVGQVAVDVEGGRLQQGGQQGGAQHPLLLAERVHQGHRVAPGIGGGKPEGIEQIGRQERERHRFVVTGAHQNLAHPTHHGLRRREAAPRTGGDPIGDVVEAVEPGDLLDEVHGPADVGAPGRHRDVQRVVPVDAETKPGEHAGDDVACDLDAEHPRDLRQRQVHHSGIDPARVGVDLGRHLGTGDLDQQLGHPVGGDVAVVGVHAPLEPGRRFGAEVEALGGEEHLGGVPVGRLHQDRGGAVVHLGIGAPHHPGQRHRAGGVAHHDVVGFQFPLDVVEGDDPTVLPGTADDDGVAEPVEVEGVGGMADFDHGVVGGVDHVGDGPHPGRLEAEPQPVGRAAHLDVAHLASHEASTHVVALDPDRHRDAGLGFDQPGHGLAQRNLETGGQFPSQSQHRHAIGTVRVDRDVEEGVGQRQDRDEVLADVIRRRGIVLVEHHDPGGVLPHRQFLFGADHAVGGDAADGAAPDLEVAQHRAGEGHRHDGPRLEVPRPADDLGHLAADVDLAHSHLVGVGMGRHFAHRADHDPREGGLQGSHLLDLESQPLERSGDLGGVGRRQRHEVRQPVEGELHRNCPSTRRSDSQKWRRSGMPWRTMAKRSAPIPKAKPVTAPGS